ncbi:hypothetical protein D9619_007053 [Psilocybe cf. subviscida]|uniref:Uncharacterized protein n=1 Tax=Psilocybe cf. subviscida TaxID=2480587 RepID=A0A8H5EWQ9_9AGAR|nr:hypothetical protein D9619_007053 [Psilocybe cf. subviscida]
MSLIMSVWCLVIDHDKTLVGAPAKFPCPPGTDIADFATQVVAVHPALEGAHLSFLTFYHNAALHSGLGYSQLQPMISELNLSESEVAPNAIVTEVVSGYELLIFKKIIPNRASLKRSRPPSILNTHERLVRSKIAKMAPSDLAKASQYPSIQKNPSERIFDDRPTPDVIIAPIALLYRPFGEFEDIFTSGVPPQDIHVDLRKMEEGVDILATEMCRYFVDEAARRLAGIPRLNKILEFPIRAGDVGMTAWSDGHCDVDGMISTIAEWKNSLAGISTFPHAQCVGYVAHSHATSDKAKVLCGRQTLPALAMTLIGDLVQFHAIILLGHQYRAIGLTAALSFSLWATNIVQRKQLYNAFIAANVLQQRIHRDLESYSNQCQDQGPPHPGHFFFPSVPKILAHGGNKANGDYIEFTILDHFAGTGEETFRNRHLYLATLKVERPDYPCGTEILVKFSRRYCMDLHDFCYDKKHAPKVLGFEKLPGGWFAIAMEHLADAEPITCLTPEQQNEVERLVKDFHDAGFVHGDLRAANILFNRSSKNFWLIDFDWGGKADEVVYPTWFLHEELLDGRQSKDLIIHKKDDERILRATLNGLRKPN